MITVTQALLDLFRARRIEHRFNGGERWRIGDSLRMSRHCALEPYSHHFAGYSLPQAMGAFSYSHSALPPRTRVGRYGSIAGGVEFIESEHPTGWVSTSPLSYSPYGMEGVRTYLAEDRGQASYKLLDASEFQGGPVILGHDVWVGQGAMFSGGVTVGDGAIVAARALVTKDVPPYAIVGGAPAKLIRMRFPDPLIERLQRLAWWRFGPEVLQPLDMRDPEGFADRLEELIARGGAEPLELAPLTAEEIEAASRG